MISSGSTVRLCTTTGSIEAGILEIYNHGLLGNSGSAINNKVSRPPGMSIAVAVGGESYELRDSALPT